MRINALAGRALVHAAMAAGLWAICPAEAATPVGADYRYQAQPVTVKCTDADRPVACVLSKAAPFDNHTAVDVPPTTSTAPTCGDGVCQSSRGESLSSCPADCQGGSAPAGGTCVSYPGQSGTQPASSTSTGCLTGTFEDEEDSTSAWRWSCKLNDIRSMCTALRSQGGGKCRAYTTPAAAQPATNTTNGCETGDYSDKPDSAANWLWSCSLNNTESTCAAPRLPGGVCAPFDGPVATQPAASSGTGCSVGSYADTADSATQFKWSCSLNGITDTCAVDKKLGGTCQTTSGAAVSQPGTNNATGCVDGVYADAVDSATQFQWTCSLNGVATSCAADKKLGGTCVSHASPAVTQPATNAATGCSDGGYSDTPDSATQFQWTCSLNGVATPCSVEKKLGGTCKTFTSPAHTQPANNTASGCLEGTYADVTGDPNDTWMWTCGLNGVDTACTAPRQYGGQCASFPGTYATDPSGPAKGCTSGTYQNTADTDDEWAWVCATGAEQTPCSATKQKGGTCTVFNGQTSSQPANAAHGCVQGTYSDAPDESTVWHWTCSLNGGDTLCSSQRTPSPVCKTYPSMYSVQPANNTASGCEAGTYQDTSDASTWRWSCTMLNTPAAACSAQKPSTSCGPAAGVVTNSYPASGQCKSGATETAVDVVGDDGDFNWTCKINIVQTIDCSAPRP